MSDLLDPSAMHWMRKPSMYMIEPDRIVIETEPHTSFHALSYDSTDAFGLMLDPLSSFGFTVRTDFRFRGPEDECGIVLRRDNEHWAKAGIECRPESLDLACTVYSKGYGDRSCREISSGIRWMYLRVLFWNGNARFQFSFNGEKFSDMRWLHFASGKESVTAGIYACSPGDSFFDCTFSAMRLREF